MREVRQVVGRDLGTRRVDERAHVRLRDRDLQAEVGKALQVGRHLRREAVLRVQVALVADAVDRDALRQHLLDPGVGGVAVRGVAREQRHRHAEGGHLREGEVDEDHAAGQDVQAQVRVDAGEHQAGEEGQEQEIEHHRASAAVRRRTFTSKSAR